MEEYPSGANLPFIMRVKVPNRGKEQKKQGMRKGQARAIIPQTNIFLKNLFRAKAKYGEKD